AYKVTGVQTCALPIWLHWAKEGRMPPIGEGSKVAIFGAGGPVGAAAERALRDHYTLRLTDLRPIAEIVAENKPQSPGAPLPELRSEERRVGKEGRARR